MEETKAAAVLGKLDTTKIPQSLSCLGYLVDIKCLKTKTQNSHLLFCDGHYTFSSVARTKKWASKGKV